MMKYKNGVEIWGLQLRTGANSFLGSFTHSNSADRVYTLPDAAGTLALTSSPTFTGTSTFNGPISLAGSYGMTIGSGAPGTTTNSLYQVNGTLYFNGSAVASGFTSQLANTVLAAPDGASGTPTFRKLVAADLPPGLGSGAYSTTIGDATNSTITVTHNLGTTDVDVSVFELTGLKRKVDSGIEIESVDSNNIRLVFTSAPTLNSLRVNVFSNGGSVTSSIFSAVSNGLTPMSGGGIVNFLRADGTWTNQFEYINFDLTPTLPGSMVAGTTFWDTVNTTLATVIDPVGGVVLQHGQEIHISATNKTTALIPNGSVVYINGAQGNHPTCALAEANSLVTCTVIGVATQDIAVNATGMITTLGKVNGVDTSIYSGNGKTLYLSELTPGALTETIPSSPNYTVRVGVNLNTTNNGAIFVNPNRALAADVAMGANTNAVPPTQAAVKAYADTKQTAYTNLTTFGSLSNSTGWLYNNGSGAFSYSTPSKSDVGLGNVENTALSTWSGTTSITTVGTIGTGTWNGSVIADNKIASSLTGKTYNSLTLTAQTTGFTIAGGTTSKTLTVSGDATVSGTNTGDQTLSGLGGQPQLNGTGFVKASGTTISYDNNSYVNKSGDTISGDLTVSGNLTINGTTTTINATTLTVDDKNIELGSITTPTDTTADGGGITLKGTTDKTLNWISATGSWTASENLDLASGKVYKIGTTSVLSTTTLGSGVTNSSLTKVGLSTAGFVKSDASGNLSVDTAAYTTNLGTVTSVGGTGTVSGLSLSGTVTTSGNLTLGGTLSVSASNFSSQTANTFLAAPNGSAGTPTFRTIVAADVPTLNQNTSGTAYNITQYTINQNLGTGNSPSFSGLTSTDSSAVITTPLMLVNNYGASASLAETGLWMGRPGTPFAGIYGLQETSNNYNWGSLHLKTRTSDALGLETKMTILSNGKVGIGTTSPGSTLDVSGSINSTGALTQGGNQVLHASNYSSYAMPLSGGTFSGNIIVPNSTAAITLASGYSIGMGDWGMRNSTPYGWIQFGPANTSWCHIYGSQTFYFNQDIYINNVQVVKNSGTWGISITGSAGNSDTLDGLHSSSFLTRTDGDSGAFDLNVSGQHSWIKFSTGTWVNNPYAGNYSHVLSFNAYTDNRTFQIYCGDVDGAMYVRRCQGGTNWHAWERILSSTNYNSYSPSLTGSGASGTWSISINGNANTVSSLSGHNISELSNNSGYITSSGSCNYANSAGSAPANGGTASYAYYPYVWSGTSTQYLVGTSSTGWQSLYSSSVYMNSNIVYATDFSASSDVRLKTNISLIPNAIDKIKQINGVTYNWNELSGNDQRTKQAGVIAQEVLEVLPEAVNKTEDTEYYSVSYNKLVPLLIEGIKEQQAQIEQQQQQINLLLEKLNAITK